MSMSRISGLVVREAPAARPRAHSHQATGCRSRGSRRHVRRCLRTTAPATAAPSRAITTSTTGSGTEPPPWSGASAVGLTSTARRPVRCSGPRRRRLPCRGRGRLRLDSDSAAESDASADDVEALGSPGVGSVDGSAESRVVGRGRRSGRVGVGAGPREPPVPPGVGDAVACVVGGSVGDFVGAVVRLLLDDGRRGAPGGRRARGGAGRRRRGPGVRRGGDAGRALGPGPARRTRRSRPRGRSASRRRGWSSDQDPDVPLDHHRPQ